MPRYEETDTLLGYAGEWTRYAGAAFSGGSAKYGGSPMLYGSGHPMLWGGGPIDGVYHLSFHNGLEGEFFGVFHAISTDKIHWTILNGGEPLFGGSDETVYPYDGKWFCWYNGESDFRLATNNTLVGGLPVDTAWEQDPGNPILDYTVQPSWMGSPFGQGNGLQEFALLPDGSGGWRMWCRSGLVYGETALGYFTSADGKTFTPYAGNPVLGLGAGSFADGIAQTRLYEEAGTLYLYCNVYDVPYDPICSPHVFTSTDGIAWTIANGGDPYASTSTGAMTLENWGTSFVWKEGTTYYMLQEAWVPDDATFWRIFLLSSDSPTGPFTFLNGGEALSSLDLPRTTDQSVTAEFTGTSIGYLAFTGPQYGIANVVLDGGEPVAVDLYSADWKYQQEVWASGTLPDTTHTLTVSYAGLKNPASVANGFNINVDAFDVAGIMTQAVSSLRYEQNDPRLSYAGLWKSYDGSAFSGGSVSYCDEPGSVTAQFTGAEVAYLAFTGPDDGIAHVVLDDLPAVSVDLYSPFYEYKKKVWSATGLAEEGTPHVLTIRYSGRKNARSTSMGFTGNVLGTRINLDALVVTGSPPGLANMRIESPRTPAIIILDAEDKAVCLLSNAQIGYESAPCRFWADTHTEDLTGVLTYDFTCEANHADSAYVIDGAPILIRNDDGDFRHLRIVTVDDVREGEKRYKVVHAENAAQELNGRIVRQVAYTASDPATIAAALLAGSRWEVGDVADAGSYDIEYKELQSVHEAIRLLAEAADLEVAFRIKFNGSVITHRHIDLVARLGQDRGVVFEYAKNLKGVKRTSDTTRLATRMVGAGQSDSAGVFVNFASVVWATPTDPADKANGLDYVQDDEAIERWGVIEGVYNNPDIVTGEALIHATWKELQLRKDPALTYEVDPVLLEHTFARDPDRSAFESERVRLGDTVYVKDATFEPPLLTSQRITELKRGYATSTPTVGAQ